mgnify:CR=1 FL=1
MIHYLPSRKRCWQMKNIFVNYVHRHWIGDADWNQRDINWSPLRRSGFTVLCRHNSRPGFRKGDFILSKESQKEDTNLKTCASCARTFNDIKSNIAHCPKCGRTKWLGKKSFAKCFKTNTPNPLFVTPNFSQLRGSSELWTVFID